MDGRRRQKDRCTGSELINTGVSSRHSTCRLRIDYITAPIYRCPRQVVIAVSAPPQVDERRLLCLRMLCHGPDRQDKGIDEGMRGQNAASIPHSARFRCVTLCASAIPLSCSIESFCLVRLCKIRDPNTSGRSVPADNQSQQSDYGKRR